MGPVPLQPRLPLLEAGLGTAPVCVDFLSSCLLSAPPHGVLKELRVAHLGKEGWRACGLPQGRGPA